jgi:hypothetical protein
MPVLCILSAGKTITLAASLFTLSWTHSVEKVRWEEDWAVTQMGLEIVAARVKGSGAGMEVPDDAVLKDGWWIYRPSRPPRPELMLAASGATASAWTLCTPETCIELGASAGDVVRLSACGAEPPAGASQPR